MQEVSVSLFFISEISFDLSDLVVTLDVDGKTWAKVTFAHPRAFRFFSESDEFRYLSLYNGVELLSASRGCGIIQSTSSPYLMTYLKTTPEPRLDDGLRSVLITTAQECIEVIAFEQPEIQFTLTS